MEMLLDNDEDRRIASYSVTLVMYAPKQLEDDSELLIRLIAGVRSLMKTYGGTTAYVGEKGYRFGPKGQATIAALVQGKQIQTIRFDSYAQQPPGNGSASVWFNAKQCRVEIKLKPFVDDMRGEATTTLADFVRRWFVPLDAASAFISFEGQYEDVYGLGEYFWGETMYTAEASRRGFARGTLDEWSDFSRFLPHVAWGMALSTSLCQRLGGQDSVLRDAPTALNERLGGGVWLQLPSAFPSHSDRSTVGPLVDYLVPLLRYSSADVAREFTIPGEPVSLPERILLGRKQRLGRDDSPPLSEVHPFWEPLPDPHENPYQYVRYLETHGRNEEVVAHEEEAYRVNKDYRTLMPRAHAYFGLYEYEAALADYELYSEAAQLDRLGNAFSRFGHGSEPPICYWYVNQPENAVATTAALVGQRSGYLSGEAASLLLYFAQRTGDTARIEEALRVFKRYSRRDRQYWPEPVMRFLLGRSTVKEFEQTTYLPAKRWTAIVEPILADERMSRQCQADFYIALRALREGDEDTFVARMTKSAMNEDGRRFRVPEWHLANWELERGFPKSPFA